MGLGLTKFINSHCVAFNGVEAGKGAGHGTQAL